jgi:dienelactone hydrolase
MLGLPPTFDFNTRGDDFIPYISTVTWDLIHPRITAAMHALEAKGIHKIAIIGFCWGGWVVLKSCVAFPAIKVACIGHPTIHLEEYAYKGDTVALAHAVKVSLCILQLNTILLYLLITYFPFL